MKVRMLISVGGVDFQWKRGDIVDLPEEAAKAWADGTRGEEVPEEPEAPPKDPPKATGKK